MVEFHCLRKCTQYVYGSTPTLRVQTSALDKVNITLLFSKLPIWKSFLALCKANDAKATIVSVCFHWWSSWMTVNRNSVVESCIWKQCELIAWVCWAHKWTRYFYSNQSINTHRIRILALRRMQKSVRCLRSMGNIQNGASLMRRDREEMNCYKKLLFYFLCIQKVFLAAS